MRTQIQNYRSTKFTLDLNTGSRNLIGVNKIATLIDHCTCAAGLAEVNAHLSNAARVNTPPVPLSVPLAAHRCHAALM